MLREIQHPEGAVRGYYVRNSGGQWLGFFDLDGRVFQRVPFLTTEAPWGMHTMDEGLGILFERSGPYFMREVGGRAGAVPAMADKGDR